MILEIEVQTCHSIEILKLIFSFSGSIDKKLLKHDTCDHHDCIGIYAYVVMKGDLQKYVKAIEGEG